jgi:hypothetical protein
MAVGRQPWLLTPAGLDEQWLVSLAHTDEDMAILIDASASSRRQGEADPTTSGTTTSSHASGREPTDYPTREWFNVRVAGHS